MVEQQLAKLDLTSRKTGVSNGSVTIVRHCSRTKYWQVSRVRGMMPVPSGEAGRRLITVEIETKIRTK